MRDGDAEGTLVVLVSDGDGTAPTKRFELKYGEDRVIQIGRDKSNDIVVSKQGVSWVHAELRLLPSAGESGEPAGLRLGLRDKSTNGTGLRAAGRPAVRIPKNTDMVVSDGATLILPMKVKADVEQAAVSKESLREFLNLRMEQLPAAAGAGLPLAAKDAAVRTAAPAAAPGAAPAAALATTPAATPVPTPVPTPAPAPAAAPAASADRGQGGERDRDRRGGRDRSRDRSRRRRDQSGSDRSREPWREKAALEKAAPEKAASPAPGLGSDVQKQAAAAKPATKQLEELLARIEAFAKPRQQQVEKEEREANEAAKQGRHSAENDEADRLLKMAGLEPGASEGEAIDIESPQPPRTGAAAGSAGPAPLKVATSKIEVLGKDGVPPSTLAAAPGAPPGAAACTAAGAVFGGVSLQDMASMARTMATQQAAAHHQMPQPQQLQVQGHLQQQQTLHQARLHSWQMLQLQQMQRMQQAAAAGAAAAGAGAALGAFPWSAAAPLAAPRPATGVWPLGPPSARGLGPPLASVAGLPSRPDMPRPAAIPLTASGGAPATGAAACSAAADGAWGAERHGKVAQLCQRFQLNDVTKQKLVDAMSKRLGSFDADLAELTTAMLESPNPSFIILRQIQEMDAGTFKSSCAGAVGEAPALGGGSAGALSVATATSERPSAAAGRWSDRDKHDRDKSWLNDRNKTWDSDRDKKWNSNRDKKWDSGDRDAKWEGGGWNSGGGGRWSSDGGNRWGNSSNGGGGWSERNGNRWSDRGDGGGSRPPANLSGGNAAPLPPMSKRLALTPSPPRRRRREGSRSPRRGSRSRSQRRSRSRGGGRRRSGSRSGDARRERGGEGRAAAPVKAPAAPAAAEAEARKASEPDRPQDEEPQRKSRSRSRIRSWRARRASGPSGWDEAPPQTDAGAPGDEPAAEPVAEEPLAPAGDEAPPQTDAGAPGDEPAAEPAPEPVAEEPLAPGASKAAHPEPGSRIKALLAVMQAS